MAGTNGYLILFAITSMKRKRRVFYYSFGLFAVFVVFTQRKLMYNMSEERSVF